MDEMPKNVKDFIKKCTYIAARSEAEIFTNHNEAHEVWAESPIEVLFATAMNLLIRTSGLTPRCYHLDDGKRFFKGVSVIPQFEIEKYRVDFAVGYINNVVYDAKHGFPDNTKEAIVELDGHEFHEKDEKQRRYEKKRDRALQKKGYTVFHYTGAEIVRDPFASAAECLSFVTGRSEGFLMENVKKHWREDV